MRLLVLGGTQFLGRHLVEAALERGNDVAIFTRGRTNPELFPEVERLRGDRDGDLFALEGREWDAVVDTSGYVPRVVRASAELLRDAVGHYAFVSSISVYADFSSRVGEDSPVATLEDAAGEDVQSAYGALKAACETVVQEIFADRAAIVRPGLIVGPWDPTARFTYWVDRVAKGGEVLAPGPPDLPVQLIDARDLAAWHLRLAEAETTGVFNATGPERPLSMEETLETCRRVSGSDARLVWVEPDFLLEREVGQWDELPLWIVEPEYRGMLDADVSRAVTAGLEFRPLEETVRDTLEWARRHGSGPVRRAQGVDLPAPGLRPERESELLAAWAALK